MAFVMFPRNGKNAGIVTLVWMLGLVLSLKGCERAKEIKNSTLDFVVDFIPTDAIEALDKQSWAQQLQMGLVLIQDPEVQTDLRRFLDPLIAAAQDLGYPKYSWDIHVIKSNELNAFALPGGTLGINSALIKHSELGLEVIGVLAHEVAHVAAKHGVKSLAVQTGFSFATSALVSTLLGDFGGLSDWAVGSVAKLGLLKFSRDHEREADALGAQLLQKAGYPISGLSAFFTELDKKTNQEQLPEFAKKTLSLLSTHPMSQERSSNLAKLASEQSTAKLGDDQLQLFQKLRQKVIALEDDLSSKP